MLKVELEREEDVSEEPDCWQEDLDQLAEQFNSRNNKQPHNVSLQSYVEELVEDVVDVEDAVDVEEDSLSFVEKE